MASSFDGTNFTFTAPVIGSVEQVPKWVDRHVPAVVSSVDYSINGLVVSQEIVKKYRFITLEFGPDLLPASLITQAMLDKFAAAEGNGIKTLVIEGVSKQVLLPTGGLAIEELTPTGQTLAADRLYRGRVQFVQLIP